MPDDFERGEVHQDFDWREVPPCVAVIETIERYEQTMGSGDSGGLNSALGSYFDVDAFDTLVATDVPMTIAFNLEDYRVTIREHTVSVAARGADRNAG